MKITSEVEILKIVSARPSESALHEVKRDYNGDLFQSARTDQNSSTKFD